MNYLIELTHPKHYYQYRDLYKRIKDSEHKVYVMARDKDVLLRVLNEENVPFFVYGKHKKGILAKFLNLPSILISFARIIKKYNIDVVLSKASPYAALVSSITKIRTVIEPDSEIVSLTKKLVAPRADLIITPETFSVDFGKNHKRVKGFFEDTYLHPNAFHSNTEVVEQLGFDLSRPYFVLRFISWNANHDINQYGFSDKEKVELVNLLKEKGEVYISSEGEMPPELEKYRIKIPASKIHHVLHFATMYVGDSQSMAAESALLGTPSVRFNSFVGENDMTNFKVLENTHHLLRNCKEFNEVTNLVGEMLFDSQIKNRWLEKRMAYYEENQDINNRIFELVMEMHN